ncbi:pectinesterase inhibitor 12-like [Trifolium pratense]|uniref:pectinesterase inhibitor 12-like n=1 Tax=Trifolium pratense TaxID=57577 RepID=UPI001E69623F|nr:pectinesterase inhibitor 12-like [Trifolium pratense]
MHRYSLCVSLYLFFLFLVTISHGTICSSHDLIDQTCEKCANQSVILSYSLCSTALPVVPVSHSTNLEGLAIIAMELALENVTNTLATVEKLLGDESLDKYVMGCLTDCLELYSDAVWRIVDSVDVFLSGNYEVSRIWMSSVMEAASTCQQGFEEKGEVSPLTEENYNLFQLCGIALCIIHLSTPVTANAIPF